MVPEARGQAQRVLEDAHGYRDEVVARAQGEANRFGMLLTEYHKAPEITRQRLYLENMQDVLSSTSKVLMAGKEGQSNLLYLPLDKMIDNRGASPAPAAPAGSAAATGSDLGSRVATDLQQRNSRSRESR
ncbi:Modulator of FtsH protease HflK [compost metagenome]